MASSSCKSANITVHYRTVANFFHDDSFFYIKTAQNIHDGNGATFDGINPTNGYHLLWMWLLVLIAKISPFHGFIGIRLLLAVHALLIASASLLADRLLTIFKIKVGWRLCMVAAIIGTTGFVDLGVESPILFLASWAFIYALVTLSNKSQSSCWDTLIIIVLSTSVCLARTDAILLVLALSMAIFYGVWDRTRAPALVVRSLLKTVFPAVITLLTVGLYNLANYGHFETISSFLKIHWPGTFATGWFGASILGIKVRLVGILLIAVCVLIYLSTNAIKSNKMPKKDFYHNFELVLIGANAYVVMFMVVLLFFATGAIASWYFGLSLTIVIVSGIYVVASILEKLRSRGFRLLDDRILSTILSIVVILSIGLYVSKRFTSHYPESKLLLAKWVFQNIPNDQPIFQVSGTGFVGYFSERQVINGDGLINSWEYQDFLRKGKIEEYLKDKRVKYIISNQAPQEGRVPVDIPQWRKSSAFDFHLGSALLSKALYAVDDKYAVFRIGDFDFGK
ncbi:MAG: hypothetical protein ABSG73_11950 [Candidatus Aminicenantales bacterium]